MRDGPLPESSVKEFRAQVREKGARYYRDLPWRGLDDPYAVLVSEVMLQQTQVKRVLRYWTRFMGLFPTIDALASADNALVLEMWQGLGYNRRAVALRECARICSARHGGVLPDTYEGLLALPGIGPATAGGVLAFAHDRKCLYLETNVRSVFLHHFFPGESGVSDRRLEPLVLQCCPEAGVRGWYYALLDYGAHLKETIPNPSRRSKHHSRQSAFEGSKRQKRAFIVRFVLGCPGAGIAQIAHELNRHEVAAGRPELAQDEVLALLRELEGEGFFTYGDGGWSA